MRLALIWTFITAFGEAYDFDYEEHPHRNFAISSRTEEDSEPEPEPIVPLSKDDEKLVSVRNIHCEDFSRYSVNCTLQAALLYNSSRKSPPLPDRLAHWCRSIRRLTNCAIYWNTDCGEVNDNRFDEDSIRGHKHVLENTCDDEWFIAQYSGLTACITGSANAWEACYISFQDVVNRHKKSTKEQTHYETHFYLCCSRARFRRCTLDSLFDMKTKCVHDEMIILQKFSTIISEGDVYQNCDFNMNYQICPGGDPRPDKYLLTKLVDPAASHATPQRASLVLDLVASVVPFNKYLM